MPHLASLLQSCCWPSNQSVRRTLQTGFHNPSHAAVQLPDVRVLDYASSGCPFFVMFFRPVGALDVVDNLSHLCLLGGNELVHGNRNLLGNFILNLALDGTLALVPHHVRSALGLLLLDFGLYLAPDLLRNLPRELSHGQDLSRDVLELLLCSILGQSSGDLADDSRLLSLPVRRLGLKDVVGGLGHVRFILLGHVVQRLLILLWHRLQQLLSLGRNLLEGYLRRRTCSAKRSQTLTHCQA
mmetsp:Transcript_3399/g.8095  ORF Transcript_3399/g.8095 Transcript_3399/m.8095 type:complete len:241 (-) Transcript_3399:54-776(-)